MQSFVAAMRFQKNEWLYAAILLATIIIAAKLPMMTDETYYIAFSKNLQASYVDHPPFVAYLNIIQTKLGLHAPLYERALVIVLHFISTLFLMAIVYNHCSEDKEITQKLIVTFLISYVVPVFGFCSFFIRPDAGLILSLSLLVWSADKVYRANHVSWRNACELGVGLGIGLLSKYHILLLGSGLICGLALDLGLRSQFRWSDFIKFCAATLIGILIALPMFIWNINNHFASFLFQMQHGFRSSNWHVSGCLVFIFVAALYLTPWFFVRSLKQCFFHKKYFLLLPVCFLGGILLLSSLRNQVLPDWIAPAFWLLIPYVVIYCDQSSLSTLTKQCNYTGLIWLPLLIALILPGGMWNLKSFIHLVHGDKPNSWLTLFWEELPNMLKTNITLAPLINNELHQQPNQGCAEKRPIIGVFKRVWASQLEYQQIFPGAKILNLEQYSSNFYLWRDNWADYANCHILFIGEGDAKILSSLTPILTIKNQYSLQGIGDYPSVQLQIASGSLKDRDSIERVQRHLLKHPQY